MTRTVMILAAIAAAASVRLAGQDVEFRAAANIVPVYATALDRNGRLVTTLTRDDFVIRDNGEEQPIAFFNNERQPFSVVMMLDRSGSMEEHSRLVRRAGITFVRRMSAGDRARIGTFANDILIRPAAFTSDQALLIDVLEDDLDDGGGSPVWAAVDESISALGSESNRRVVLVLSDGHNTNAYWERVLSVDDLQRRATMHDVMIYAVGFSSVDRQAVPSGPWIPRGLDGQTPMPIPGRGRGPTIPRAFPPQFPEPEPSPPKKVVVVTKAPNPELRILAEDTGGGYFRLDRGDDLTALFAQVADELHQQYSLGFVPANVDGLAHTLDVSSRRPGITVRARKGYVAGARR